MHPALRDLADLLNWARQAANDTDDPTLHAATDPAGIPAGQRPGAYWHIQEALVAVLRTLAPEDADPDLFAADVYAYLLDGVATAAEAMTIREVNRGRQETLDRVAHLLDADGGLPASPTCRR
jgi:hypothetical protein